MSTKLPTEEDIRSRIILPYLKALGLGPDQIRLEKSFYLKLGRSAVKVGSKKRKKEMGGRLDILVRNAEGDNLFVIELKAEDKKLTEEDAKQGISYARLLDQIAPFVLVSNGRESYIYDTITQKPLSNENFPKESSFHANGRSLSTTDDIRIRSEALRNFLGYSIENVKDFSKSQQARRMESLRGGNDDTSKKYIPEIYFPRKNIWSNVENFIGDNNSSVFAVIGESGVGKTNEMCAISERLAENNIALFFSGGELYKSIEESFLDEFNWHFGDQIGSPELLRRLSDISRPAKCKIILIVDAIDEACVANFEKSASDFAFRLKEFNGNIKLIVSSKISEWERFTKNRGNPSPLSLSHTFTISPFSEDELNQVVPNYAKFFNLSEEPHSLLRKHCRLPFLLRVVGEVYSGTLNRLPPDMAEEQLLKAWLNKKLERMAEPEKARDELIAVARSLYEFACNPPESSMTYAEAERISAVEVKKAIQTPWPGPFCRELLEHGILIAHKDEKERDYFSFYYGRFRDFVISTHVLELDKMEDGHFKETADKLLSHHVLLNALFWHLNNASYHGHRKILDEIIEERATLFIDTYEKILDELVPGLKSSIEPFTTDGIGVGYNFEGGGLSYCLYPVGRGISKRTYKLCYPFWDDSNNGYLERAKIGCRGIRAGGENFTERDPRHAAAMFALERINEAVEKGLLDESKSETLLKESVLAIVTEHGKELKLDLPKDDNTGLVKTPLNLPMIMESLQAYFGEEYYKELWAKEQVESKSEYVTIHKRIVDGKEVDGGYGLTYDPRVLLEIAKRAKKEATNGKCFEPPKGIGNEELDKMLPKMLEALMASQVEIDKPILPKADIPPTNHKRNFESAFSDSQLKKLVKCFFEEGIDAYISLVETNFIGLLKKFNVYQKLPITIIAVLKSPKPPIIEGWGIDYTFIECLGVNTEARVYIDPPDSILSYRTMTVFIDGQDIPYKTGYHCSLQNLLKPYFAPGFHSDLSKKGSIKLTPIRVFAYGVILKEIRELKAEDLLEALQD